MSALRKWQSHGRRIAVAACLLVGMGAYHLEEWPSDNGQQNASLPFAQGLSPDSEREAAANKIADQSSQFSHLQRQASSYQPEVDRLRDALHAAESRSVALSAAKAGREEEFSRVSEQRDKLAEQLRDAEQTYQVVQAELTILCEPNMIVFCCVQPRSSRRSTNLTFPPRPGTQAKRR